MLGIIITGTKTSIERVRAFVFNGCVSLEDQIHTIEIKCIISSMIL
jgi:hypothetical protein